MNRIKDFVRKHKVLVIVALVVLITALAVSVNTALNTVTETSTAVLDQNGMPVLNSEGTPSGPYEIIDNAPQRDLKQNTPESSN